MILGTSKINELISFCVQEKARLIKKEVKVHNQHHNENPDKVPNKNKNHTAKQRLLILVHLKARGMNILQMPVLRGKKECLKLSATLENK